MRIVLYATTILELGGGLEKYFIETASNLSKYKNVQIDVITMDGEFTQKIKNILGFYYFHKSNKKIFEEKTSDVVIRLGSSEYTKCKTLKQLEIKLNQYDIVYSKNELLEAAILKFAIGYKKLPPVVFGCHTPVYYPSPEAFHSKLHNLLYNGWVYKWMASGVKAFHVANKFDMHLLQKLFPKRKVFKIHNPFNFVQFEDNLKRHNYKFKWDKSKCNILWIARLTEQKGVSSLVRIINEINLSPLKDKVIFNIIGSGSLESEITSLKERWENVNGFGYVEYQYLPSVYANNDLFISTSKWESLPFNILEAQAKGLPTIAFDIPGPQDIIVQNKSGFLVSDEKEFIQKIGLVSNHGKGFDNRAIAKHVRRVFSPDVIYPELLAMFKTVKNVK